MRERARLRPLLVVFAALALIATAIVSNALGSSSRSQRNPASLASTAAVPSSNATRMAVPGNLAASLASASVRHARPSGACGGAITIPDSGNGNPYPSDCVVSGLTGTITDVNLSINGLSHTYSDDIDIMLAHPTPATNATVMSDAGGANGIVGGNLVLDDEAANQLPDATATQLRLLAACQLAGSQRRLPGPGPDPVGGRQPVDLRRAGSERDLDALGARRPGRRPGQHHELGSEHHDQRAARHRRHLRRLRLRHPAAGLRARRIRSPTSATRSRRRARTCTCSAASRTGRGSRMSTATTRRPTSGRRGLRSRSPARHRAGRSGTARSTSPRATPVARSRSTTSRATAGRRARHGRSPSATAVPPVRFNNKVYVIGGAWCPQTQLTIYDIATNSWSTGNAAPSGVFLSGYQTAGQYLYIVGGFTAGVGVNSTTTMRLDMAAGTWSTGPAFTPARADFGLAYAGTKLYAMGGDANGGAYFDSTDLVNELDTSAWPAGAWAASPPNLPAPIRQANQAGFFSTGRVGGEIWSTGGINGTDVPVPERSPVPRDDRRASASTTSASATSASTTSATAASATATATATRRLGAGSSLSGHQRPLRVRADGPGPVRARRRLERDADPGCQPLQRDDQRLDAAGSDPGRQRGTVRGALERQDLPRRGRHR